MTNAQTTYVQSNVREKIVILTIAFYSLLVLLLFQYSQTFNSVGSNESFSRGIMFFSALFIIGIKWNDKGLGPNSIDFRSFCILLVIALFMMLGATYILEEKPVLPTLPIYILLGLLGWVFASYFVTREGVVAEQAG